MPKHERMVISWKEKRFFKPEAIAQLKRWTPIALISTSIVVSVVLISTAGYQVYRDRESLQHDSSEENQRRFNASLELLKTLATLAGGIALYLNFRVANTNAQIAADNLNVSEEKQVTERFAKAVEQLGSDKVEVRLGAIYALERIAKDSPKDHWTIMEVLSAYIRERLPVQFSKSPEASPKKTQVEIYLAKPSPNESADDASGKIAIDIQAALTVIGRRKVKQYPNGARIDLRNTNLARVDLTIANLTNANLTRANLANANLWSANLEGAYLIGANLEDANLRCANLWGANLWGAKLQDTDLESANLEDANLRHAILWGAILWGANLRGAILLDADLRGVKGWTDEQLSPAKLCLTILPDGSKLDANRDCKALDYSPPPPANNSNSPESSNVITPEEKEEGKEGRD